MRLLLLLLISYPPGYFSYDPGGYSHSRYSQYPLNYTYRQEVHFYQSPYWTTKAQFQNQFLLQKAGIQYLRYRKQLRRNAKLAYIRSKYPSEYWKATHP